MLNKKLLVVLLIFIFSLAPISPLNFIARSQTIDQYGNEHIIGYREWDTDQTITNFIIIDNGATLVIKKGVTVTFDNGALDVLGTLITEGTIKENIKFKKADEASNYSIGVDGGKLVMRNTDMSGGGASIGFVRSNTLLNAADAFYQGGIQINGGALDVEGCSFHDNDVAIYVAGSSYDKIRINRNKFTNNQILDVFLRGYYTKLPDFQYNWWGNATGPAKTCYSSGRCYYDKIDGNIDSSNFLKEPNFHDPVIIIPGIMGSVDFMGNKILMPMVYDNLYKTFKNNGYTPNKDLFEFPYEWRASNVDNAKLLRDKINEIKQIANWPEVDVVAHSMGGLLTREYIESDYYQNDIDQLVTLGTPENGSPMDYLTWEGGKLTTSHVDVMDLFLEDVFNAEAKENDYTNLFDYIRNRPIKSVQELLPTYSYLWDTAQNKMRTYPSDYPTNPFLENINLQSKLSKLSSVVFTNIVGKLDDTSSTINKIRVGQTGSAGSLWEHGYPENFDSLFGDQGLEKGAGDGTVPLESAANIPSYEKIEMNSSHLDLPSKGADIAYEALNGNIPAHPIDYVKIGSILSFFVFSPVDIQIITPDNKRIGKDFETGKILNEIDGAFYSGYKTNSEFITIPNPKDGQYKILTQGAGDGSYRIEATKISEDPNDPQKATESTGVIEGVAKIGQEETATAEVKGSEVFTKDIISPTVQINRPSENEEFLNNQILSIDYKTEDNKTISENMRAEIYLDDNNIDSKDVDLSLQNVGSHKVKINATDEAGNVGSAEVNFQIIANINSISDNINHYNDLGSISNQETVDFLQVKIDELQHVSGMLVKLQGKQNANPPANQISLFNKKIDDLVRLINEKVDLRINEQAKSLLTASLNSIKY